ncbi:hypothetical protein [Vibrio europaeus]|uniref:hypothetical protein n=1 Tax=Vibrio europaeus TaxID=300876 RepID=UPI0039E0AD91
MKSTWRNWWVLLVIFLAFPTVANCKLEDIVRARTEALQHYEQAKPKQAATHLSEFYDSQCDFYQMNQGSDQILNQGLWLISDLMLYRRRSGDLLECLILDDIVYNTWMVSEPSRHNKRVNQALKSNATQCRQALDAIYLAPQPCPIAGYESMAMTPKIWQTQGELWFEVACIGIAETTQNKGYQRDGPKMQSEGMNQDVKFDVLCVSRVNTGNEDPHDERRWVREYQLDALYLTDRDGEIRNLFWGCNDFTLRFSEQEGQVLLDGNTYPCEGSGSAIQRATVEIEYPIRAVVNKLSRHVAK